ncbi:hypothetical protein [Salinactinospora qingdaonensis]|uniref:PknH-like extracellular domain-containing protein n=1 Tax=Salinactinospora qingdaonensis TaxID=702744 RepID=A0ABP7F5L8_9ACTN
MKHSMELQKVHIWLRTAVLGVALAGVLSGCASADESDGAEDADPNAEAAAQLSQAQIVQFNEAKVVPERSESGTYSTLATVRRMEELREKATVDKADCMDAVNRWGRLAAVRQAPASLATFVDGDATITHLLIELSDSESERALATEVPEECASYTASVGGEEATSYHVNELDLAQIGAGSRAFLVTSGPEGQRTRMHNLTYRGDGYLGVTAVLNGGEDAEETLVEFTKTALERERTVLS